jgi:hypothetical protein
MTYRTFNSHLLENLFILNPLLEGVFCEYCLQEYSWLIRQYSELQLFPSTYLKPS